MRQISWKEIYDSDALQSANISDTPWHSRHFYTFYIPFLAWTKQRMQENRLWNAWGSQEAETDFLTGLMNRLEAICLRALVVEIQYSRASGLLGDGDPGEQYGQFVETYLRDGERMQSFWEAYPQLYDLVTDEMQRYGDYLEEILGNLERDRQALADHMGIRDPFARIVHLRMDRGDIHGQGKAVAELELDNGMHLYYKPGNKALKQCFMDVLNGIYRETGLAGWPYRAVIREDHAWEEAVESRPCQDREERFRYYKRLGMALFLCYQWGVCDIHCENVISQGEFPVLIDVEVVKRRADGRKIPWGLLNRSVLSSGILPRYLGGDGENRVNPGVLCLDEHQKSAVRHLVLKNLKTSEIRLELEYTDLQFSNDIPKWPAAEEQEVVSCIQQGFCRAAEAYQKIDPDGSSGGIFGEHVVCRYIHRPTNEYAMLLFMLWHPKYLTDRQEAERLLQAALSRPGNGGVENPHVAEWEAKCLLRGEIPLFTFAMGSRRLCCGSETLEDFFADETGEESAGEKLSERNLRIQENLIAVSMAGLRQDQHTFINGYTDKNLWDYLQYRGEQAGALPLRDSDRDGKQVCRQAAGKLLRHISENAFCAGQEPGWWSAEIQFREKVIWDVTEMPPYFYQGKAGISILLHQALAQGILPDGEGAWLADRLDRELFRCTDCLAENGGPRVFGAMSGEYSLVYRYQYLYGLTGEERYLDYAGRHLALLDGKEPQDAFDLLAGLGGMAIVWLNQWQLGGGQKCLETAGRMLDRLSAFVQKEAAQEHTEFLPGMAHGWSGLLMAFQRYASLTGSSRYEDAILLALKMENDWYRPEFGNWEDIHRGEPMDTVAWCHGAAGILLCRMELMESGCPEIAAIASRDAARAAEKIQSMPLRKGYCLCHGNLGNIAILKTYAQPGRDAALKKRCTDYMRAVAEQLMNDTLELLPQEAYDFGLMNGLGGIAAALMDRGETVPDIMALRIPKKKAAAETAGGYEKLL